MSASNKVLRIVLLLFAAAIMGVLVWRFAYPGPYYFYSIAAAALVVLLAAYVIFLPRKKPEVEYENSDLLEKESIEANSSLEEDSPASDFTGSEDETDTIPVEKDFTDLPPAYRAKPGRFNSKATSKPDAGEVAARYRQMAANPKNDIVSDPIRPSTKAAARPDEEETLKEDEEFGANSELESEEITAEENPGMDQTTGEPPIPLIEDETTLTEEEKVELVNAVWYRCENPYCKYTTFLTVHHIVDEKDGGSNKLDNLIVLCPFCHDLAHRNEMPVEQMQEWIVNREERFKFKPDWHYF